MENEVDNPCKEPVMFKSDDLINKLTLKIKLDDGKWVDVFINDLSDEISINHYNIRIFTRKTIEYLIAQINDNRSKITDLAEILYRINKQYTIYCKLYVNEINYFEFGLSKFNEFVVAMSNHSSNGRSIDRCYYSSFLTTENLLTDKKKKDIATN